MKQISKIILWLVRLGLVLLCMYCAGQAWAGIPLYRGMQFLKDGESAKAIPYLKSAGARGEVSAALDFAMGQAFWQEGVKTRDPDLLREAEDHFRRTTVRLPDFGKAWMYLALSKYMLAKTSRLDGVKWREIYGMMSKAEKLQPGNLWIIFQSSLVSLSYERFLSPEEKTHAIEGMRFAARALPESYLKPTLRFFWKRYHDTRLLLAATPETYGARSRLLDFLAEQGLWEEWHDIYESYRKLKADEYSKVCLNGERLLADDKTEAAEKVFRSALWIDPSSAWARAGYLCAYYGNHHENLDESADRQFLRNMLEEGEPVGNLLPFLQTVVRQFDDPYLKGLYSYRRGRMEPAVEQLNAAKDERLKRYFLASVMTLRGEKDRALEMLTPPAGAPPLNVRELSLLYELLPQRRSEILHQMKQLAPVREPAGAWQTASGTGTRIFRGERAGLKIILLPGKNRIFLRIRNLRPQYGGVLLLRLGDRVLGTIYAKGDGWKALPVEISVNGGEYWLSAEMMGRKESGMELGDILVSSKFPETEPTK